MGIISFDDRPVGDVIGWKTIWTGTLQGRNTLSLNVSEYSKLKIYAVSYGATMIFELDLTKTMPNTITGLSGYPYVASCTGGQLTSSNVIEQHFICVGVNTAKTTIYNANMGYSYASTYNLRNNNASYYIYQIDGHK